MSTFAPLSPNLQFVNPNDPRQNQDQNQKKKGGMAPFKWNMLPLMGWDAWAPPPSMGLGFGLFGAGNGGPGAGSILGPGWSAYSTPASLGGGTSTWGPASAPSMQQQKIGGILGK